MRTNLPIFLEVPDTVREWRTPELLTLPGKGGRRRVEKELGQ